MAEENKIADALQVIEALGMPRAQQNDRSALCLLALLDLRQSMSWSEAMNPLVGITPMMEFARDHYGKRYAPNTRETFRRQTMHQLVAAGIALYNPDDPARPVNSLEDAPVAHRSIRHGSGNEEAGGETFNGRHHPFEPRNS